MPKRRTAYKVPKKFSIARARLAQRLISERVLEEDILPPHICYAAGVDLAFLDNIAIAAAVVIEYPSLKLVRKEAIIVDIKFPYIPTLLAFREVYPSYIALKHVGDYDILFVDGNGKLHPFKAGFACHLGVIVDKPTIGIAKKLLCGKVGEWYGDKAPIFLNSEVVGYALKTGRSKKPIYVSVGHKITLETAIRLTKAFTKPSYKLPEPIRQAHILANNQKAALCENTV